MPKELSERERLFVQYLVGEAAGNATKAAELSGVSLKSAGRIGYRLSKRVHVQEAIEALRREVVGKAGITKERIIAEMSTVLDATPDKPPTWGEKIKVLELGGKLHKMWDDQRAEARVVFHMPILMQYLAPRPTAIDAEVLPSQPLIASVGENATEP